MKIDSEDVLVKERPAPTRESSMHERANRKDRVERSITEENTLSLSLSLPPLSLSLSLSLSAVLCRII